jgi:hypothetical protein
MVYSGAITLTHCTLAGNSTTSDDSTGNGGGGINLVGAQPFGVLKTAIENALRAP